MQYKITISKTDGTNLTINAKCREFTGMRKSEDRKDIPIYNFRNVTVVIPIEDLTKTNTVEYIKEQVEAAYAKLPDETLSTQLKGITWSN